MSKTDNGHVFVSESKEMVSIIERKKFTKTM